MRLQHNTSFLLLHDRWFQRSDDSLYRNTATNEKTTKGVTRLRKNTHHRTHSSDLSASMRNIPHTLPHPTPLRVVFLALPKSAPAFAVPVYPSLRYPPASQFAFRQLGREHPDSDGRPLETISRGRSHRKQVMLR